VALAALEALPATWRPDAGAVERGFAEAFIAGRLDRRGRFLFDVAHNPDGVRTLVTALAALRPRAPIHAVVAILGDKDWPEMLRILDGTVERGVLTIAPTAAGRGWNLEALDRWLGDRSQGKGVVQWTIDPELGRAVALAQEGAGTVLVTGSFHTVGDAMHLMGLDP